MMTSSRLVRGTKGRLFACLGVLTLFAGVIFLYHSTRVELDEVRNALGKCHQEQDSLAAQVQVISEYKKNLEKSLNQEKAEHRITKEELQSRMTEEHQLRGRENQENVKKYNALQQQYKILQGQHEDEIEACNKAKIEQDSCAQKVSDLKARLDTLEQSQTLKETETNNLKLKYLRLEEENKTLFGKLSFLQNKVEQGQEDKEKLASAVVKRASTKETDAGEVAFGVDSGTGNRAGFHELPQNVLPAAQKSSTATQEILPARPAQPGLLQPVSKTSGKQTTTPQINPDALQSQDKASHRALPALPMPLLLSHVQQHVPVEKQDFGSNGQQGVLPAPLGFGSDDHYAQNAVPLQAPYRLHGLNQHEVLQNQGQMPPFAPVAAAAAVQNNVIPAPPNIAHHVANFNEALHSNMNPFRNDLSHGKHNFVAHQVNLPDKGHQRYVHSGNFYHLNNLSNNLHQRGNAPLENQNGAQDAKHLLMAHDNQFQRVANAAPFKSPVKSLNIVPLDGDVNQHSDLEVLGGNPFVELGRHNQDSAHGKHHLQPGGQQEGHQAGPYNYQGGDYDKEDPPANNEGEEDLDHVDHDYNNELQDQPGHNPVQRRLADRHQGGVVVHPR